MLLAGVLLVSVLVESLQTRCKKGLGFRGCGLKSHLYIIALFQRECLYKRCIDETPSKQSGIDRRGEEKTSQQLKTGMTRCCRALAAGGRLSRTRAPSSLKPTTLKAK